MNIIGLLPVIGYGIFFASLIDFFNLLFPLQLQNPAWELQTIRGLVDQSWGLLIGMGFICSRYFAESLQDVRLIEVWFLKFIRWFFLILAIVFLFLLPLVVLDSVRMTNMISQQATQQQQAKIGQIEQIQTQSSKITNPNQLRALAQSLRIEKNDIDRLADDQLLSRIDQQLGIVKAGIAKEAEIARQNQVQKLWQNSLRMMFSQILLVFIFIFTWSKFGRLGIVQL